ncbi:HAD family hydrolase [Lysobacter sp. CCNWLW3]|uniref:D-glycero-alpha-D-manno-heptose-1,7-bisphosphate 7-phosphatase n=1 Tax=unclassified Lysobacter TaxID=2635362 RepID=UPI002FCFA455
MAYASSAPYIDPGAQLLLADVPAPHKALFLDRDGVINTDHGYVHTPERTDWVPGIFDLAAQARSCGFLVVVVTNQAGIARGYYDEAQFYRYTQWVHEQFASRGAPLLATYFCPHHPDAGLGELKMACSCRKPQPGMLLQAAQDWDIRPASSVLVGDQASDIEAARLAGLGQAFRVEGGDWGPALDWIARAVR